MGAGGEPRLTSEVNQEQMRPTCRVYLRPASKCMHCGGTVREGPGPRLGPGRGPPAIAGNYIGAEKLTPPLPIPHIVYSVLRFIAP
jgi:hypothetical protein